MERFLCHTASCFASIAITLVLCGVSYADATSTDKLTKLSIPAPDDVSPELQRLMQGSPHYWDVPKSLRDWRHLRKPVEKGWLQEKSEKFRVDVVTREIGAVRVYQITPKIRRPNSAKRLLLHLHSGAFVFGEGEAAASDGITVAGVTGYGVLTIEYRLLPDYPFPSAIDDAMAVWNAITKSIPPSNIGIYGSSAGGGLALSLVQRAIDEDMALPGAVLADSPWADLSKSGDSRYTQLDLIAYDGFLAEAAKLYANGRDLKDPKVSPVYGDFVRFPPTFLVSGVRDFLLSDTVRVHAKLRRAGVKTELVVQEGGWHCWLQASVSSNAPEALEVYAKIAQFFDDNLSNY